MGNPFLLAVYFLDKISQNGSSLFDWLKLPYQPLFFSFLENIGKFCLGESIFLIDQFVGVRRYDLYGFALSKTTLNNIQKHLIKTIMKSKCDDR